MRLLSKLILISLLLVFSVVPVRAHGDQETITAESGEYLPEIRYDLTDISVYGSTTIDFLLKNKDSEDVDFDSVWVKIEKDGELLFAGPLSKRQIGPTSITYSLPQEGEYLISARFQNNEDSLAEASFPLVVDSLPQEKPFLTPDKIAIAEGILIVILIGVLAAILVPKKTKKAKE